MRFIKFRNFFSISVIMEKSPFGRFSLTVVTFSWGQREIKSKDKKIIIKKEISMQLETNFL